MSEARLDLIQQAVRNMLAALQIDVDDDELPDLTLLIGHTVQMHQVGVKGEACLKSCPIIFEREDDNSIHVTPPCTPPTQNTSDAPRKSSRIASDGKRSYEGMQSRQNEGGRPRKKFKYFLQEIPEHPINSTVELASIRDPVGGPHSGAATNTLTEVAQRPIDDLTSSDPPTTSLLAQPPALSTRNSSRGVATVEVTAISATDAPNNETEIHQDSVPVDLSIPNSIKTTYGSLITEHGTEKRPVLDDSGHSLESILEALESLNTDRITDSTVPGKFAILTDTEPTVFAKIISTVAINCVQSSLTSLASVLAIEKEKLRNCEENRLLQIKDARKQMALFSAARSRQEQNYREEEERLHQETVAAIGRLSIREIANRDISELLSEPAELLGEFKEEYEFDTLIKEIDKENAYDEKRRARVSIKETYYWPIIQRRANRMGPLPDCLGRKSGLTPQEKYIARRLVIALGYGHSSDSILKARSYLRLLSDLREAGVTLLLLYRTKEFRTYFLRHPNEFSTALSWHQLYGSHLHELRLRSISRAEGDFSGRCDFENHDVFCRLHIPQGVVWRDDCSDWGDIAENKQYLASHSITAVSGKSNAHVLCHGIKGDIDRNKSIYVSMIPYEGVSGKKTLTDKSASAKLIAVSPLVAISPGDFLGIFSGKLRYTDEKPPGAIQGPVQGLWLDRSEVKGRFHWVKTAKAGEHSNVCLVWEGVNEAKGDKSFCQYWRILLVATRHIMPFDQLIRPG